MPELPFKRISVIGLGYIGLPTAAMFASRKVEVVGVDVNQKAVDTINRGEVHIVEPDLDLVVRAVVKEGYLRATTVPEPAEADHVSSRDDLRPVLELVQRDHPAVGRDRLVTDSRIHRAQRVPRHRRRVAVRIRRSHGRGAHARKAKPRKGRQDFAQVRA